MRALSTGGLLRLSRSHRLLGLIATIPLIGWVISSLVLRGVVLALPNGLQGVYDLESFHSSDVILEDENLLAPSEIFTRLESDRIDRIYWLRLEPLGGRPVYVVKPGPFDLERTYDARTGERLDPLTDEMLRRVGNGALRGSQVARVRAVSEFNRYYTVDPVPAVSLEMEGSQPSELLLSRSSGRTLRRTDPLAAAFDKAYRSVHVWQWGPAARIFTTLLYTLVGLTLTLVTLGYTLWITRREARRRWTSQVRPARRFHARLAPVAGIILSTQMLVGAYLWFNLGLIEPRFRGQGSFHTDWTGGIAVVEDLAEPSTIAAELPPSVLGGDRPIQRYEWRAVGDRRFWIAYTSRDENGVLMDASTGRVLPRLTPELARTAAEMVVLGEAVGPPAESVEYWMDFNARVPTYLFRFADPDRSDVHVSQITGEVVQRRPAIWRAFGPFLAYHTFGFTGNAWFDMALLTTLQLVVVGMVVTGWRLARPIRA
ncbi:MAG: hypothetical protein BMS9Abin29_0145 [Gemmatimonadota bacterium]|nr:MAG: hypothetical protein BMS9Abin29_0145 [Gemmatimonadota bacterium]